MEPTVFACTAIGAASVLLAVDGAGLRLPHEERALHALGRVSNALLWTASLPRRSRPPVRRGPAQQHRHGHHRVRDVGAHCGLPARCLEGRETQRRRHHRRDRAIAVRARSTASLLEVSIPQYLQHLTPIPLRYWICARDQRRAARSTKAPACARVSVLVAPAVCMGKLLPTEQPDADTISPTLNQL